MKLKPDDAPASTVRGILTLFHAMPAVGVSPYALQTLQEACDLLVAKMGETLPSYFKNTINAEIVSADERFFSYLKPAKEGEERWDLPSSPNFSALLSFLDEQIQTEPRVIVGVSDGPDRFIEIHSDER